MVTIVMTTHQSVSDNLAPKTKPWSCVRMGRMSSSQLGNNIPSLINRKNTPLHALTSHSVCSYRKAPSDKCEGGFAPQLAVQTLVRPCGVKRSPGPPDQSSSPITHFDTPVSCYFHHFAPHAGPVFLGILRVTVCHFKREKLVLILVCAGAGVIVLVAVVSTIFAARRVVSGHR